MDNDGLLVAHEQIMNVACDQCHWPFVYTDEETMYAEKCEYCRLSACVEDTLKKVSA